MDGNLARVSAYYLLLIWVGHDIFEAKLKVYPMYLVYDIITLFLIIIQKLKPWK